MVWSRRVAPSFSPIDSLLSKSKNADSSQLTEKCAFTVSKILDFLDGNFLEMVCMIFPHRSRVGKLREQSITAIAKQALICQRTMAILQHPTFGLWIQSTVRRHTGQRWIGIVVNAAGLVLDLISNRNNI